MKYLILISFCFLLYGCKKKLTEFYIDYGLNVTIPASVPVDTPFTINTPEQTTNSEHKFESNDTRKDKIESISLRKLELTITSPDGETFSFLNSLEVYISSANQPEIKIAYKNNIPDNVGDELICNVVGQDFQEYIKEDYFKIRLVAVTDEIITQDVDINVFTKFFVNAKLVK